jgi:hypothetical protein
MGKIFRLKDLEEEENEPPAIDWMDFAERSAHAPMRLRREKAEDPEREEKQEKRRLQKIAYMAKYREQHPYQKSIREV